MKKKIIVVDSAEKCGGTSLKHLLRLNFNEDNLFDLDNGDPPDEPIRGYGIKCPIDFPSVSGELKHSQNSFYDAYSRYINLRATWIINNFDNVDVQCIYGNGIMSTPLLEFLRHRADVHYCKFFRNPYKRLISEYYYVLGHKDHNLHPIAKSCKDICEYVQHPFRPKNRQTASVIGDTNFDGQYASEIALNEYAFIGFVESFDTDLKRLSNVFGFDYMENEKRNKNTTIYQHAAIPPEFNTLVEYYDSKDHMLYYLLKKNVRTA